MKYVATVLCLVYTSVTAVPAAPNVSNGAVPPGDDPISHNPESLSDANTDCICVPYYQCPVESIITSLLDPKIKNPPEEELPLEEQFQPPDCGKFHVCCATEPEETTARPYQHFCGVRKPGGINRRILSAREKGESEFGEWPWQAAIMTVRDGTKDLHCGGALIDNYHVLTVAHCVQAYLDDPSVRLIVRLGEWDTQVKTELLPHEDYDIESTFVHPGFNNRSYWNDVAILKLDREVKFSPHIDTVCLPNYGEQHVGEECVVTGWGQEAFQKDSNSAILREDKLPIIDNVQCQEVFGKILRIQNYKYHDGFLCVGGIDENDKGKGDGGGPLMCFRQDGTYSLVGLATWDIQGDPTLMSPSAYMDVSKFLDWISEVTGKPLAEYWPSFG